MTEASIDHLNGGPYRMYLRYAAAVLFSSILLSTIPVSGQSLSGLGESQNTGTSYYRFVRPGESSIQVTVLGSSGASGIYEVGQDTDLSELLALMGGAGVGPKTSNTERTITIELLRRTGGQREAIYQASLRELMTRPGNYPSLQQGDMLSIDVDIRQNERFTWRDGLQIVSTLSSLTWLVVRITTGRR